MNLLNNYITKTIGIVIEKFNSKVPKGTLTKEVKNEILNTYFNIGDKIEEGKFKSSLIEIMSLIKNIIKN